MVMSILIVQSLYVSFNLIAVGLAVTTHLLRLETLDKEAMPERCPAVSISRNR